MAVIFKQSTSITTVSGTATATIGILAGLGKQIFVEAATSSTTFDVKLTDIHGLDVYEKTLVTFRLNEQLDLPAYGQYTLTVSNASADEAFSYLYSAVEQF